MDEVNLAAIFVTSVMTGLISAAGGALISTVILKERVQNLKEADLRHENALLRMESNFGQQLIRIENIATRAHTRIDTLKKTPAQDE